MLNEVRHYKLLALHARVYGARSHLAPTGLILIYLLSCTVSKIWPPKFKNLYIWLPLLRLPPHQRRGSSLTISVKFSVNVNGLARYQLA